MKRVISFAVALCMLFGVWAYAIPVGAVTYGYVKGDADDSSAVSVRDVLVIRKYLADMVTVKDINLLAADVNGDEDVTVQDVLYIRKMLADMVPSEENNSDGRYEVDTVTVGGRNISRFTVVIPEESDECMRYSAERFRFYIKNACGIDLNITDNEEAIDTYKIKYLYDTEELYDLGKEGFRISVEENGDLLFYCGTLRGALYVTYTFLEEIVGYRFLSAEKLDGSEFDPYLYEAENVNIPVGYENTDVPELSYRAPAQAGTTTTNFQMLKGNAVDGHGTRASANVKYGGGVGTLYLHAFSYYYLVGGDDYTDRQPCLSSDDTYQTMLQACINLIEERKGWGQYMGVHYTQISVSPNHSADFCTCAECNAMCAQDHSMAGPVFRLSNRLAEQLEILYPGVEIFTMAYWDAKFPPKYTRPAENVCVCYAVGGCNNHPYDMTQLCTECGGNPRLQYNDADKNPTNQRNDTCVEYFDEWSEITSNIYIWYHCANFIYYLAPSPTLFNIYNDFKYLADGGIEGIYCEGSTSYYSFEYLRCYLVSKMLWNPYMSEDEFNDHMNEFLAIYYGDGWEYIREYLDMNEYAADLNGCFTNNYDRPWDMYNEQYYLENYHTMRELFDNAYDAASTDAQRERIRLATLHCDFLGLSATYERDYENGSSADRELYKERYQFLYDKIVEYSDKGDRRIKLTSYGTGKGDADNFPATREDIYSPMQWVDDDFTGRWEWNGASWQ